MKFKDYYDIMGVSRDASQEDVKRAYRRLARKYHPDVSKESDAEERFKEVAEAYEVLKDPEKRTAYDQLGKNWKAGQDFRPPPDWERGFTFSGGGFTGGTGFSDFFETLFGRDQFGFGGRRGGLHMKGEDQHARVAISLEEAYGGTNRTLSLDVPEIDARGQVQHRRKTLTVNIPKGVRPGQRIRLGGQGGPSMGGGRPGDLYLVIDFLPHRHYRVEGRDIYLELPVAPWEAALGSTVKVPTLGGSVELKIPQGSQSGRKLRLKGRGLPGTPAGDQYVVLQIVTPEAKTPEQKALYERMAATMAFDPRADLGA